MLALDSHTLVVGLPLLCVEPPWLLCVGVSLAFVCGACMGPVAYDPLSVPNVSGQLNKSTH